MSPSLVTLIGDGSAASDVGPVVQINRRNPTERYRWTCPNGHIDFSPTNSHIWCKSCRRMFEAGHDDVDPEHYDIVDKKTGEKIPWSRVEIVE